MRLFLGLVCSFSFVAIVSAQVPEVRQGSFELGGFVGASYGVDSYRVMGGGNVSYAVTKILLPYVEYSYFPGIERSVSGTIGNTNTPFTGSYSVPLSDFHGGVHVRLIHKESKFVPYAVFGVGGLTYSGFNYNIMAQVNNSTITSMLQASGATAVAINFGAGVRYYVSPRYGFRLEAKGYKPYGDKATGFTDPFMKAEAGFFIQLK